MKTLLCTILFAVLFAVQPGSAQTNTPARLAMISETADATPIADVLTAQLSGNAKLQLLERDQIEKVYREQALSAANKDYLKLGQILGADGLLLLEMAKEGTNQFLNVRLLAVKPGVVLIAEKFPWSQTDLAEWSAAFAKRLDLFLPKLTVLAKDAIPISVVNLRSAITSADAAETERQLKLLAIQRLSRERQFFVLERQKMSLLSEEKDLKADDSAFWNGSYLLEGVVDQNGYSENTITLNARLTPPRGGAPVLLAASGSRTNLAEVINQLAAKINDALKLSSTAPAWNAADEAKQYFDEANWAMRWGVFPEAQAAADSAWALGKRDLDCATLRIKAYEVPPDTGGYQAGEFTNPGSTNEVMQSVMEDAGSNQIFGLVLREQHMGGIKVVHYVSVGKFPDPKNLDCVLRALRLYAEFSRTLPPDEPQADSAWYRLGIEVLTVAAQALQHFHFVPAAQKDCAEKLADVRGQARSVAAWLARSASVHDSYFVGDRPANHEELAHTMDEQPNLFRCEVNWGCFWQETPADCVAMYRGLMNSPVFGYIHRDFWLRELQKPRLTAWHDEDRARAAGVWQDFMQELNQSTNVLWPLEAKAVQLADADDEPILAASFTNLFTAIFKQRAALVANPVELFYLDWAVDDLVSAKISQGIVTDTRESLQQLFNSEYRPKLEAMEKEYLQKTDEAKIVAAQLAKFESQKALLKAQPPFDSGSAIMEFDHLFAFVSADCSKAQALELLPMVAAFKTNLLAQVDTLPPLKGWSQIGLVKVKRLETDLSNIVNPSLPKPRPHRIPPATAPAIVTRPANPAIDANTNAPEAPLQIVAVRKFFPLPTDGFQRAVGFDTVDDSVVTITAHRWLAGKLLLNFDYLLVNRRYGSAYGSALAAFDPATEQWEVASCPEMKNETQIAFYYQSTLFQGEFYDSNGGQIKKYQPETQQWETLKISDGNNYELFALNGHLYAANRDLIFEILDGGNHSQILASTRRQPPVTILDTHGFGLPILFEGPGHSLRVIAGDKIYAWTGVDWQEEFATPAVSLAPEVFADGILFRHCAWNQPPLTLTGLTSETTTPELYLWQKVKNLNAGINYNDQLTNPPVSPVWQMPDQWFFVGLTAGLCKSNLYLLADYPHAAGGETNICDNTLLFFSRDETAPQKVFLKFAAPAGRPPLTGSAPTTMLSYPFQPATWMVATTDYILFGDEHPRFSPPSGNQPNDRNHKTGIWLLAISQIAPIIAEQKAARQAQAAATLANAQRAQKNLFDKYDLNHNGIIDPAERAAALADPVFIQWQWETIDAHHNARLDLDELVYFDANQNKILEPKEQAGIKLALHWSAQKLLEKFDADADGVLNRPEYDQMLRSSFGGNNRSAPGFLSDPRHEKFDLTAIQSLLDQQIRKELRQHGISGATVMEKIKTDAGAAPSPQQLFKLELEAYWNNKGTP